MAGFRYCFYHIRFVWGIVYGIRGCMCVPQAKTIVVFCDQDNIIHACRIRGFYPTVCVNSSGAVTFYRQFAVRPFCIIKSVDPKMQKHSEFTVNLCKLPFVRGKRRLLHNRVFPKRIRGNFFLKNMILSPKTYGF